MMILAKFAAGSTLLLAAATSGVPTYNVAPSCRSAVDQTGISSRDFSLCMSSENSARDELVKRWSQFKATERTTCHAESSMGGLPSYVELLVCLDMFKDTREVRAKEPPPDLATGTGAAPR